MSSLVTIGAFVAGKGKPSSVSIADDIHIFHFEADDNWRQACLLFVNRNGHHFRVLKKEDGRFHFIKTWNGLFERQDWMEPGLSRPDPVELIQLCGSGAQKAGDIKEALCLLPRDATMGRRKAAWRGHLLDVGFNRDTDTFTLFHPYDQSLSSAFSGKPWQSRDAAAWCAQELAGYTLNTEFVDATAYGHADPKRAPDPVKEAEIEAVLENSGMWGMF